MRWCVKESNMIEDGGRLEGMCNENGKKEWKEKLVGEKIKREQRYQSN